MIVVMGMKFANEEEVPDFGSIALISPEQLNVKHYRLKDEDVNKLDLITNADNGSDALTDKNRMFTKLSGKWEEHKND